MPKLNAVDWLVMLLYIAGVLGIAYKLKSRVKTGKDFFQAGRALPAWMCGIAVVCTTLGAPEVIAMGASGARFGLETMQFFWIGAVPAMLFAGIFMIPLYYGSKARSLPEFLGMRFDQKTRAFNACAFALMMVFSSGISIYIIARVIKAMHLLDSLFLSLGLPLGFILAVSIVLAAIIVGACIFMGGLTSAIYSQVLQFLLLIAGLLPLVLLGLQNIGGWDGLKSAAPPASLHAWQGMAHSGSNPMGIEFIGLGIGLGLVLSSSYWCADFRVIQMAMASKNMDSARKAPLIAAILTMFIPFLAVLPGLLAIGQPTPHTTTVTTIENGSIVRNTTVVPREVEAGKGLIPAKVDPLTGQLMRSESGETLLDYDLATPNMLLHFLPTGLLGLGITALLASFIGGAAGNVAAFNTVFTCDLYQPHIRKGASDRHYLAVGRAATVGGLVLSLGTAFAAAGFSSVIDAMLVAFSIVTAPLFATFLLGVFWKRATGHGAFAGLIAGTTTALLHQALTLPVDAHPGIHGGWLAVLHRYPSDIAQSLWGAIIAFSVNFLVTIAVSLVTKPRPASELVGLVRSLTPPPRSRTVWWKRPEAIAVGILVIAIALNLFFA